MDKFDFAFIFSLFSVAFLFIGSLLFVSYQADKLEHQAFTECIKNHSPQDCSLAIFGKK